MEGKTNSLGLDLLAEALIDRTGGYCLGLLGMALHARLGAKFLGSMVYPNWCLFTFFSAQTLEYGQEHMFRGHTIFLTNLGILSLYLDERRGVQGKFELGKP